jgi:hypothetical protein
MDAEGREMGTYGKVHGFDAATVERLLAGQDAGLDDLSALLAAAKAPPRPHELAGEARALVAFRRATLGVAAGGHRRRSTAKSTWARLAGIKVAAVAAALVTAGVALAAGTGILPSPFDVSSSTAAPDRTSSRPDDTSGRTVAGTTGGALSTGDASATRPPSGVPAPSQHGLCRAYRAQVNKDPGHALDSPAFAALIEAAGGRDNVDGYCDELLDDKPGKPTAAPGNPNHPTGPPESPGQSPRRSAP